MKKVIGFCFIVVCVFVSAQTVCADLVKITDNVYSYVDVKDASPANSFGANAGIIIGKDGIVVVDTLVSSKEALRFIEDIRKVSDKPVRYVVNTHYHFDHAFGNSEFEKLGAVIVGHENCKANSEKTAGQALKNAEKYGLTSEDIEGTRIAGYSLTFRNRMTIEMPGSTIIELIYFAPSHSTGSTLVYLPTEKVLFAGDILFTDFHPFMGESDIAGWLRVLDYILWLDVEKVIPGHGPLSSKKDVRDMKNYLILFDKHATGLAAKSKDVKHIESEMLKILPKKSRGAFLIPGNIQMKYMGAGGE